MSSVHNTRYIVVAGGVISGVGKGVATASLGKMMKMHGYKTTLIKIDPYINVDAGTLRPTEHGEVWVTADGGEIDQDLGTYERFINEDIPKKNNITTGQIYQAVIERERAGGYLGHTVQFVPHITDEITDRIKQASEGYDIAIVEIGGTVGDYENAPFLFALKALERDLGHNHMAYVLVTYLPVPDHIGEMKTKPTLQAIRMLNEHGIVPDFILCRSPQSIDQDRRQKIEQYAHIKPEYLIAAPNIKSVYQMPLELEKQGLGLKMLAHLGLEQRSVPDWSRWEKRVNQCVAPERVVRVAVVGKYLDVGSFSLTDSYLSIHHALLHAGAAAQTGVSVVWIDAKQCEGDEHALDQLASCDGVIVPGGFGTSGVEGKMNVIRTAREQNIPYLGICYGMQLAVVEYARNVCGLAGAHTAEVDTHAPHKLIDILPLQKELLADHKYGGTMRLGSCEAIIKEGTIVHRLYTQAGRAHIGADGSVRVSERHRHRYEVNPAYVADLEAHGLLFSGYHERADGTVLMEFVELPAHPFFVATQAHPEFTSRFSQPNPLFAGFVQACLARAAQRALFHYVAPQAQQPDIQAAL